MDRKNFWYRNVFLWFLRLDNMIYYAPTISKINFYFLIWIMWYLPVLVFLRRLKIFHSRCCLFTLFSQFNLEKLCTLTRIFTYSINVCCIISTWITKIFINLCHTLFIFISYLVFFWKKYDQFTYLNERIFSSMCSSTIAWNSSLIIRRTRSLISTWYWFTCWKFTI